MKIRHNKFIIIIAIIIVLLFAFDIVFKGKVYQISCYVINELKFKVEEKFVSDSLVEAKPVEELTIQDLILLGAREEAENKTLYDASYAAMAYPEGDVSSDIGACTDVVIRALRNAEIDLQQLIHEDMKENFELYPQRWGLSEPDPNIDHRRVHNQIVFLERHGESLSTEVRGNLEEWKWGDIVYWSFPDGSLHTGIVSDRATREGIPLVIHNTSVTKEENCLFRWQIIGHYRFP
ncbi:MAG: hypothetical protein APF76_15170 [Desulfitibacter sp. BRH_c19]|nr:MAG: hypothetical protein APF76_15170 [Desulfitibacter sp. BRH_c19]